MIQEILKAIRLLFDTLYFGAQAAVEKAKPYANLYIKGLLFLALVAILSPIPFLIIGIIGDRRWLIALTGIWWAIWTFILLLAASPIGILIESLTGGIKGSGQRYIKWVSGILFVGLCISLFASIIPIKANLDMLPLLIVAAIILGILNTWMFSRKVITPLVSIIFIGLILSFYFPTTIERLGEKISGIDFSMGQPEGLYITYEDLKERKINFFQDGKPKVFYYRARDGKIELFNRKGHHPIYKEKLKPVTPDVVSQIENQLKIDAERKVQEEKRKKEEALELERQKQKETERLEKQKEEEAKRIVERKQKEADRLAKERAAQKREDTLNRYLLERSFINRPESQEVAVLVIDEGNRASQDLTQKIATLLKIKGPNVTASLFTAQFISDGIFEKIFKGDAGEVKKLELPKFSDHIILGKKSVSFTENPEMQNMITARAVIEIHIISTETGTIVDSFTVSEVGAGFSKVPAENLAMERILKKLGEINWEVIKKGGA